MNVIVCLDDNNGMTFNHRRQSRDKKLLADILTLQPSKLYINSFSEKLFSASGLPYTLCEDMLSVAKKGEYCFVENLSLKEHIPSIEKLIIYRWNRTYPFDFAFDIPVQQAGFTLRSVYEFEGNSHEKITREVFEK